MYTIVDRYDNERETWSKSDDTLCLGKVSETDFYETSFIRIIKNLKPFVLFSTTGKIFHFLSTNLLGVHILAVFPPKNMF